MSIITLTTDFGLSDWFVGAMKGVLLRIQPRAQLVDITHQIPPGDIRAGAFALASCYSLFPRRTVHLAVVDPGVGSSRAAIVVQTKDFLFVGPNNGVLSFALDREVIRSVRRLENPKFFRPSVSRTFHGRDVFAPIAAHLSKGAALAELGPEVSEYTRLPQANARRRGLERIGEVIYIDHFGNTITNISDADLAQFDFRVLKIHLRKCKKTIPLHEFYQAVPPGQALGLIGSTGFLEIAINGGNAARAMGLKIGEPIAVRPIAEEVRKHSRSKAPPR
jgi:S-adenosylmethionine hydrolase